MLHDNHLRALLSPPNTHRRTQPGKEGIDLVTVLPSHPNAGEATSGASGIEQDAGDGNIDLAVVLVLPDEIARRGVTDMLGSIQQVGRVRAFATVDDAVRSTVDRPFHVAVVDSALAGDVAPLAPSTHGGKVLLLLRDLTADTLRAAADAKADGFLLMRGLTLLGLTKALDRMRRGEMVLPAELAQRMMGALHRPRLAEPPSITLTPREAQILDLLGQGLSNKQIASRVGISQHGAKRHVANVLAKLNCPNRTLAVAHAIRIGLLRGSTE